MRILETQTAAPLIDRDPPAVVHQPDAPVPRDEDDLDARILRFDEAWRTGPPPTIADFLPAKTLPGDDHARLLAELVMIDMEYRWRRMNADSEGSDSHAECPPRAEDYLRTYPAIAHDPKKTAALVANEFRVRTRWGDRPRPEEFLSRFQHLRSELLAALETLGATGMGQNAAALKVRCPHCRHPIDVAVDAPLVDLACPTCGSSFSLATSDADDPSLASEPTRIAHFELLSRIGAGQFGTVWKARDASLDRTVAIKIPRRGELAPDETEYFLRDARAAAQLSHPNIVSVHEVGRDGQSVYIASDFIEGATLHVWAASHQPTARDAAELIVKIAEALHHAHERGVIHRDLKPANILIDAAGEPHVTDFGLAKRETGEITMTVDGQILGTPAYMSPEQARGKAHEADARSDVYTIGVILFELLTGELPFRGEKRMLLLQILHDDPPRPRRLNAFIHRDLETICLKAMAKSPASRYESARHLADDLRRHLAGQRILARPAGRMVRLWNWCRRKPTLATLLAVAAAIAVVSPIIAGYQAHLANQLGDALTDVNNARREESAALRHAEKTDEESQRLLYDSHMMQVEQFMSNGEPARALALLASYRQPKAGRDFRGFEWYYWWRECNKFSHSLKHTESIAGLAWTRVWHRLYVAEADGTITVWDPRGPTRLQSFRPHISRLIALALSEDDRMLAASYQDGSIVIVRADTGEVIATINAFENGAPQHDEGFAFPIDFSPSGSSLASLAQTKPDSACELVLWDVKSGKRVDRLAGNLQGARCLAFSPDGRYVATAGVDRQINLWDVAKRQLGSSFEVELPQVASLAYSEDGTRLAIGGNRFFALLYSTSLGKQIQKFGGERQRFLTPSDRDGAIELPHRSHTGAITGVAIAPGNAMVATTGADHMIRLDELDGHHHVATLVGHMAEPTHPVFSPDSQWLASGDRDGVVKLWRTDAYNGPDFLKGGKMRRTTPESQPVTSLAGDQSNFLVATMYSYKYDPSYATQTEVVFRSGNTGKMLKDLWERADFMSALGCSHDGRSIALGSGDNSVTLWHSTTLELLATLQGHARQIRSVEFSPDDKTLASASLDGTVRLWDVRQTKLANILHGPAASECARYSPDGRLIASVHGGKIWLWDAKSCHRVGGWDAHKGRCLHLAFSLNGNWIASAGDDRLVKIWRAADGQLQHTLVGHARPVRCVDFAPDGMTIASVDGDWVIRLWDPATGESKGRLLGGTRHFHGISAIAFARDGSRLISAGSDGEICIWRTARPEDVKAAD